MHGIHFAGEQVSFWHLSCNLPLSDGKKAIASSKALRIVPESSTSCVFFSHHNNSVKHKKPLINSVFHKLTK